MLNEQTVKLYEEIQNGAKMGICLTSDMLKKYNDEQFRYELICAQNEYRLIEEKAKEAIREYKTENARNVRQERMATAMEVAVIETAAGHERPKHRDVYERADEQSQKLANELIAVQIEHRNMYRRFLN